MEIYDIPNYRARKAALIAEISTAFDGVLREGGVSMSEAEVIDDYGSDEERMAARLGDTDTRWQDVPDEQLALNWPLSFFDPIGFLYYLPAYMIYYLRWIDDYMVMGDDAPLKAYGNKSLNFSLSAGYKKGEIEEFYSSKFEMFTPAQGRATAHFLQLEAERSVAWDRECEHFQIDRNRETDEDFHEWRANKLRKAAEKLASVSPAQLQERERQYEQWRAQFDWSNNDEHYALDKYWGRFL